MSAMPAGVTTDLLTSGVERELDAAISTLTAGVARWAASGLAARAALIAATHEAIAAQAEAWAQTAINAKGVPAGPLEAEEWMSGPYATLSGFATTAHSLAALAGGQSPLEGLKVGTAPGGRTTFRVLPTSLQQWTLFHGFSAEIWLAPGVTVEQAKAAAGLGARNPGENGGVGLVLGAGNISAIAPLDVLYELVAFNRASVLKLNPTFASLIDVYKAALAPLIDAGLLHIVNGAAEVGGYLAGHDAISHVHITGSRHTHDAIVWGTGPEGEAARAAGTPRLTKPISSELGGVSPLIVIPGNWSQADLAFQAEQIATQRLHNAGHNCIATQALIVSADWPQKDAFLAQLRDVLDTLPRRASWYPGTERKLAAATASYPGAEDHAGRLLVEVSPDRSDDLLHTEYFAPVLGHVALPGTGADFFRNAVAFANDKLDGSLGAGIAVAPADRRAIGTATFDEILADLRYGTIGVNVWSGIGFLTPGVAWGAFPGNTLADVGSGIGIVHNAHLAANVERSVVTGPFRPFPRSLLRGENSLFPKPPWFVTARSAKTTARRLTTYAHKPSWLKLPGIFAAAFRA